MCVVLEIRKDNPAAFDTTDTIVKFILQVLDNKVTYCELGSRGADALMA